MSKDEPAYKVKFGPVLVGIVSVPLLLGLGFWQLERAEEKKQILARFTQASTLIEEPEIETLVPYARVALQGRFDLRWLFMLDNKMRDGAAGYEVLGVFNPLGDDRSDNSSSLLVNLGWVKAGSDRQQLPEINLPAQVQLIRGRVTQVEPGLMLAPDQWALESPIRIQQIDYPRMQKLLDKSLYQGVVLLEKPVLAHLDIRWEPVNMLPQQHIGYAVQWFALAAALLIWICCYGQSFSRKPKHRKG